MTPPETIEKFEEELRRLVRVAEPGKRSMFALQVLSWLSEVGLSGLVSLRTFEVMSSCIIGIGSTSYVEGRVRHKEDGVWHDGIDALFLTCLNETAMLRSLIARRLVDGQAPGRRVRHVVTCPESR